MSKGIPLRIRLRLSSNRRVERLIGTTASRRKENVRTRSEREASLAQEWKSRRRTEGSAGVFVDNFLSIADVLLSIILYLNRKKDIVKRETKNIRDYCERFRQKTTEKTDLEGRGG